MTGSGTLGRLSKVDLRAAWISEAFDFTPWLANPDNLELLGEAIGIELELESQEKSVGPFSADLLCKDVTTGEWVIVENQLERTDHTHLGQVLTYAAGLGATTVVWVAQRFRDEHRAALDWLNENTSARIRLFGLEIELWQIDCSVPAPKFNIVCQPNEWSRTVQSEASTELTATKQLQLRFWTEFKEFMEAQRSPVRCQKPLPRNGMNHSLGKTGIYMVSIMPNQYEIWAQVYIEGPNAKKHYVGLAAKRELVDTSLGFQPVWQNPEDRNLCRIYTVLPKIDTADTTRWPEYHEWLKQHLEAFQRVFAPLIRQLRGLDINYPA